MFELPKDRGRAAFDVRPVGRTSEDVTVLDERDANLGAPKVDADGDPRLHLFKLLSEGGGPTQYASTSLSR